MAGLAGTTPVIKWIEAFDDCATSGVTSRKTYCCDNCETKISYCCRLQIRVRNPYLISSPTQNHFRLQLLERLTIIVRDVLLPCSSSCAHNGQLTEFLGDSLWSPRDFLGRSTRSPREASEVLERARFSSGTGRHYILPLRFRTGATGHCDKWKKPSEKKTTKVE